MALKPSPPRKHYGAPVSFRLDPETALRLRTLSEVLNMSQAKVVTELVDREYADQMKVDPKAVNVARKRIGSRKF